MSLSEFELISRYFRARGPERHENKLGIGDDAALIRPPGGMDLAVTVDTLVAGIHFPSDTAADAIGHKALAVSLSDLAAMGAEPALATLALTLPEPDPAWLEAFSAGFFSLAAQARVALVGGDTTRGPLTVTVQLLGWVAPGKAVLRGGARPGDLVCVTGTLGDAGLALMAWRVGKSLPAPHAEYLRGRLDRPSPRHRVGMAMRGWAHAMIDISDGLAADLDHILISSGVGATIDVRCLPLSASFRAGATALGLNAEEVYRVALGAGDDYELCMAVSATELSTLEALCADLACPLTVVGVIEAEAGLRLKDGDSVFHTAALGYEHFVDRSHP